MPSRGDRSCPLGELVATAARDLQGAGPSRQAAVRLPAAARAGRGRGRPGRWPPPAWAVGQGRAGQGEEHGVARGARILHRELHGLRSAWRMNDSLPERGSAVPGQAGCALEVWLHLQGNETVLLYS